LLLTEVRMPVMYGGELARAFHTLRPDTRVLFMSAYELETLANSAHLHLPNAIGPPPSDQIVTWKRTFSRLFADKWLRAAATVHDWALPFSLSRPSCLRLRPGCGWWIPALLSPLANGLEKRPSTVIRFST
jgi:hypothetical protein